MVPPQCHPHWPLLCLWPTALTQPSPSLSRAVTANLLPHVEANCPPHHPCLSFLTSLCPSLTPVMQCPTMSLLLQRCCSLVTTHGAVVPPAGFPCCVHPCTHTRGRRPFALLCNSSSLSCSCCSASFWYVMTSAECQFCSVISSICFYACEGQLVCYMM